MDNQVYNPSTYTPHAFIQIGRTGAMFTLRTTYLQWIGGNKGYYAEWSHYHQNLGTTPDIAYEKATILSKQYGLELHTTRENLAKQLRDITRAERRTSEEIEAIRIQECFNNNMHNHDPHDYIIMLYIMGNDYARLHNDPVNKITDQTMPFGKHNGKTFKDINLIDRPYLEWMADQDNEKCSIWNFKIQTFLENNTAPIEVNEYLGEVKQRLEFNNVLVKSIYQFQTQYGISTLYTMCNETGHTLITFYSGTKVKMNIGGVYNIKGTIKGHKEYRNVKQTVLTRINILP